MTLESGRQRCPWMEASYALTDTRLRPAEIEIEKCQHLDRMDIRSRTFERERQCAAYSTIQMRSIAADGLMRHMRRNSSCYRATNTSLAGMMAFLAIAIQLHFFVRA